MLMVMAMAIMMRPIIERRIPVRHPVPGHLLIVALSLSLGGLLVLVPEADAKATGKSVSATNNSQLIRELQQLDPCIVSSIISFVQPLSPIPTNPDELSKFCQTHNEAYKCVKEKSKGAPPVIRRGLVSLVTNMGRMTKKYCADPNSQMSRKFMDDLKCVVDKHAQQYRDIEIEFLNSFYEINRQNYTDSVLELKYICCSLYKYRKSFADEATKCPSSRATLEEVITNIVASNVSILCDDEQHLLVNVCPKLPPLKVAKTPDPESKKLGGSAMALYLIATLGE